MLFLYTVTNAQGQIVCNIKSCNHGLSLSFGTIHRNNISIKNAITPDSPESNLMTFHKITELCQEHGLVIWGNRETVLPVA